ncbi:MAG: chemotaxis protein CheD [Candidatus Methylomirabilia bacterium]
MSSPTRATSFSSTLEPASIYLPPGLLYAAATPGAVTTVLGSCVAVCLFDTMLQAGGMNHYLLPYWNGDGLASPKYANIALPKLLEKLLALGCRQRDLRAKIFGGGAMFQNVSGLFGVGERNIQFAEQYLADAGIPVVARDVGEGYTRKLVFHVHTGGALVRRLKAQASETGNGR